MRKLKLAALAVLLIGLTAGCGPVKGEPCDHAGNIHAHGGTTLVCTRTDHGLRWQ